MNWKRIIPGIVLAVFLTDTALIVAEHGYLGFFELALANTATQLMAFDLVIALTLASVWMVVDARRRSRSAVPYLIVTLLFGAAGPLLYLTLRAEVPAGKGEDFRAAVTEEA